MKRLICLLSTVLFLFCAASCSGGGGGTLAAEEFNVYQDGKVYLAVEDIQLEEEMDYLKGGRFEFGAGHETKRGLKIGDTVTRVKELYGNEMTNAYDYSSEESGLITYKVSEYINAEQEKDESSIFLNLYRRMYDGKVVDEEEIEKNTAFEYKEYMSYFLNIRIENSVVTVISVSVSQYTKPAQS